MGKPFDEERAPRMDATSRAAAEIDRVHTLEARIAILETELRACTRLRAENERLSAERELLERRLHTVEQDLDKHLADAEAAKAEATRRWNTRPEPQP